MIVNAGLFDEDIEILEPSISKSSDNGSENVTYTSVGTIYGSIDTRANNEQFIANKRNDVKSIVINVRENDLNINTQFRFNFNSALYQVKGYEPNTNFPRNEVFRLTGEAVT